MPFIYRSFFLDERRRNVLPFDVGGFPGSNLGAKTIYADGNVSIGNPAGLNFSGPITMIAWVKPQYTDGLRNIVSHGYRNSPDLEVQMRINGGAYEIGSWSPGEGVASKTVRASA